MVAAHGSERVRCWSFVDPDSGALSLFLLNKDTAPRAIGLRIDGWAATGPLDRHRFAGTGPEDVQPTWTAVEPIALDAGGSTTLTLPGPSLTVLNGMGELLSEGGP